MTNERSLRVQTVKFKELIKGKPRHGIYKPSEFSGRGTKIIKMGIQSDNSFIDEENIPELLEVTTEEAKRFGVFTDDLLFLRTSLVLEGTGKCSIVRKLNEPVVFVSNLIAVTLDKTRANPLFYYYYFSSDLGRKNILSVCEQTAASTIRSSDLQELAVPFPKLDNQNRMAAVLYAFDRKIELNQKMNKTLEAVGKAVFRRWFVDFEFPDEEGKPYKSSGGKMVHSELGLIPMGWEIADISKVTDVNDCLHSKKPERIKEGKVLLQVFNIGENGETALADFYCVSDADYDFWTRNIEVKKGDLIISKTGRVGAIAQIPEGYKFGIGRNLVAIRPKKISPTYTLEYLLSKYGQREIQRLTMSGTILRSLHVKYIKKIQISVPSSHVIDLYEKIARPFRAQIENNIKENITLSQLRDILLPKLMSGKIRVPVAEDNVEVC